MNDQVMDLDISTTIEADEWAELEPVAAPLSASAELQRQVDEYVAQGGRIREFEPGQTAVPVSQPLWSFPVGKAATPDPLKRAQAVSRRKAIAVIRGDQEADTVLVAKMDSLVGTVRTGKELSQKLGVSPSVIYRLAAQYFADDKRADPFRKRTVEERAAIYDALMLPRIREALAAGMKGLYRIADYCGASYKYVSTVNKKYKLGIAKEAAGNTELAQAGTRRVYTGKAQCINDACRATINGTCHYCPGCGHITAKGQLKESGE